jgi:hypothetical protein
MGSLYSIKVVAAVEELVKQAIIFISERHLDDSECRFLFMCPSIFV